MAEFQVQPFTPIRIAPARVCPDAPDRKRKREPSPMPNPDHVVIVIMPNTQRKLMFKKSIVHPIVE